jgi:Family of unknown function (DUF6335)
MAKKAGTRKAGSTARTRGTTTRKAAPASRARGRKKKTTTRAGGRKKAVRKRPAGRRKPVPRTAARKAVARKTAARKAVKKATARKRAAARKAVARKATRKTTKPAAARKPTPAARKASARPSPGATRRKAPAAGKASPKPAMARPASPVRKPPALDRARRQLLESDDNIPTPPSSLDMDRMASAARTGRREMAEERRQHHESSPVLTAGDVDADWEDAYAVGDEAPGGDNPTPDQDRVDDIGRALGVQYQDNEELKGSDKIAERDKHRWELDPASSDDYQDRD